MPEDQESHTTTDENALTNAKKPIYRKLVFKGGGARGYIHLGVVSALAKMDILKDIAIVAGSSAGGIAALLVATGWPLDKITERLKSFNVETLLYQRESWWFAWYRWWYYFGMYRGDGLTEFFMDIVEEVTGNPLATFEDWHKLVQSNPNMKDILVEACNISTTFNEVFSYQSRNKNVPIAIALRASMAYPGVFTPVQIGDYQYSDGGLQSDCPIRSFFNRQTKKYDEDMLAVWLDDYDRLKYIFDGTKPKGVPINSASDAHYAQGVAMHNKQLIGMRELFENANENKLNLILCDTVGVPTLKFNLDDLEIMHLEQSGFYGVVRLFMKKHREFTRQLFDPILLNHMIAQNFPLSVQDFANKSIVLKIIAEQSTESINTLNLDRSKKESLNSVSSNTALSNTKSSKTDSFCQQGWCYLPIFKSRSEPELPKLEQLSLGEKEQLSHQSRFRSFGM